MKVSAALDWLWLHQQKEQDERRWQAALRGVKLEESHGGKPDRAAALMQARTLGAKFSRIPVSKTEKERRRQARLQRERMRYGDGE